MSIKIEKHDGILDYVDQSYRLWKYENVIHKTTSNNDDFSSEVKINNDLGFMYADKDKAYYHVIDFDESDIFCWDFISGDFNRVASHESFSLCIFHREKGMQYYRDAGSGELFLFNERDQKFYSNFKIDYPCRILLDIQKNVISVGMGLSSKVESYSLSGELGWSKSLEDYGLDQPLVGYDYKPEIKQCSNTYSNNILFHVKGFKLVCVDVETGDLKWVLPDAVLWQWCIGNNGKVYSIFKGHLKIIDAETGELLSDKPINADWVRNDKDGLLNLFQVEVSSTHLWCGFMGKGLCAINLETADVDWHDFDGQTCNRKPIIKNNRIYVQMMGGGIGLNSEGNSSSTQEYILEGEGGYIADSDNEFIVF